MTKQSSISDSSRKLSSPAAVFGVVAGTYCIVAFTLLALYFALNSTILLGTTSRYLADSAFGMAVIGSASVSSSTISPSFKQTWVFAFCFLTVMLVSCISVLLNRVAPDLVQWYTGPLWTGLYGGIALSIVYWLPIVRRRTVVNGSAACLGGPIDQGDGPSPN